MGDHYIPQYYLKGFLDPSSSLVWVYEKNSQRVFRAGTKQIARENKFYSRAVEQYLANEIEGPANNVIKKIRNREIVTTEDKLLLAQYMIVMLKRVPRGKERIKEKFPRVGGPVFKWFDRQIAALAEKNPSQSEDLEKRRVEAKKLWRKYRGNPPKEIWLKVIPPETTSQSLKILEEMTLQFLVSDNGEFFLTGDNPVFYFKHLGIGNERSEVTFPISSTIALLATHRKNRTKTFIPVNKLIVREINRRTISIASRYVYSCCEADWIVRLVNKRKLRVREIADLLSAT
jgi:hypothetical protein